MPNETPFIQSLQRFVSYYDERWQGATVQTYEERGFTRWVIGSTALLREKIGNCPQILHHNQKTDNVLVLVHGLTDSPYYVQAIAEDFAQAGFNVVLPLLPAHGLRRPGRAFQSLKHIDWTQSVDSIAQLASPLGEKLSLGGFSTGGALPVY